MWELFGARSTEVVGKRKTCDLQVVCEVGRGGCSLVGLDLEPVGPALTPVWVRTELWGIWLELKTWLVCEKIHTVGVRSKVFSEAVQVLKEHRREFFLDNHTLKCNCYSCKK